MPMDEIASRIRASGSTAVLVDSANSDGLQYAPGGARPWGTEDPHAPRIVAQWLAYPSFVRSGFYAARTTWQPADWICASTRCFAGQCEQMQFGYEPFTPFELAFIRRTGVREAQAYFRELVEYRK